MNISTDELGDFVITDLEEYLTVQYGEDMVTIREVDGTFAIVVHGLIRKGYYRVNFCDGTLEEEE